MTDLGHRPKILGSTGRFSSELIRFVPRRAS